MFTGSAFGQASGGCCPLLQASSDVIPENFVASECLLCAGKDAIKLAKQQEGDLACQFVQREVIDQIKKIIKIARTYSPKDKIGSLEDSLGTFLVFYNMQLGGAFESKDLELSKTLGEMCENKEKNTKLAIAASKSKEHIDEIVELNEVYQGMRSSCPNYIESDDEKVLIKVLDLFVVKADDFQSER